MAYLKAKWMHHVDEHLQQMQITTEALLQEKYEAEEHDEWIEPRVEYMYDHLDFKNDRHRVRERFI